MGPIQKGTGGSLYRGSGETPVQKQPHPLSILLCISELMGPAEDLGGGVGSIARARKEIIPPYFPVHAATNPCDRRD